MKLSFAKPSTVKERARLAMPVVEVPVSPPIKVPTKRLAARVRVSEKKQFESLCQLSSASVTVTVALLLDAWWSGEINVTMARQDHVMSACERLVLDVPEEDYRALKAKAAGMGLTLMDVVCCLVRETEVVVDLVKRYLIKQVVA